MSYIKEAAMTEPLVDCVNAKAVNSVAVPVLTIDIRTVTVCAELVCLLAFLCARLILSKKLFARAEGGA